MRADGVQDEHVRFVVTIDKEKSNEIVFQKGKLDETWKNELEKRGFEITIVYFEAKSQQHQIKKVMGPSYIPENLDGKNFIWDVCLL